MGAAKQGGEMKSKQDIHDNIMLLMESPETLEEFNTNGEFQQFITEYLVFINDRTEGIEDDSKVTDITMWMLFLLFKAGYNFGYGDCGSQWT
jgi:hypothetical protein